MSVYRIHRFGERIGIKARLRKNPMKKLNSLSSTFFLLILGSTWQQVVIITCGILLFRLECRPGQYPQSDWLTEHQVYRSHVQRKSTPQHHQLFQIYFSLILQTKIQSLNEIVKRQEIYITYSVCSFTLGRSFLQTLNLYGKSAKYIELWMKITFLTWFPTILSEVLSF